MQRQLRTLSSLTDDADGIAQLQALAGAGNMVLNGALVSGGVATLGTLTGQRITLDSAANLAALTFTVTGTDENGRTISEAITGPNTVPTQGNSYFQTVTQIAVSGGTGVNTVSAGTRATNGAVASAIVTDWYQIAFAASLTVVFDGTLTVTVQTSADDPYNLTEIPTWFDVSGLTGINSNEQGNIVVPLTMVRLKIDAYTSGSVTLTYIQGLI